MTLPHPQTSHVTAPDLRSLAPHVSASSFGLLATSGTAKSAAVFVHGFGGHPQKTWAKFEELVLKSPMWAETDCFFVGYDSVRDEISLSAKYVSQLVKQLGSLPRGDIFDLLLGSRGTDIRHSKNKYDDLRLIGHSEGGVLVRLMTLDLLKCSGSAVGAALSGASLFEAARLLLFAPAIGGARLSGSVGRVASVAGLRGVVSFVRGGSPAFQELMPDSLLLRSLRDDTNYFADKNPSIRSLRADILWAHKDDVVSSNGYRFDADGRLLHTTHATVCKPINVASSKFMFASLTPIAQLNDVI